MPIPEWRQYCVGAESRTRNFTEPSCRPFTRLYHVAHRRSALHIIEDGRLRGGLVYDKGVLRKRRIAVSWVSPNTWYHGSRYGNVEFAFHISDYYPSRTAYWVEVISDYSPPALRFLLTDQDRTRVATPYDPTVRNGPWWYDAARKQHFFNGDYCLEFMVEGDIHLGYCRGIDFVDHHANYCCEHRTNPTACKDIGLKQDRAGARFLARLLSGSADLDHLRLVGEKRQASGPCSRASRAFFNAIFEWDHAMFGGKTKHPVRRRSLARAILAAYGEERRGDAKSLLGYFKSWDDFRAAAVDFIVERLDLAAASDLELGDVP